MNTSMIGLDVFKKSLRPCASNESIVALALEGSRLRQVAVHPSNAEATFTKPKKKTRKDP